MKLSGRDYDVSGIEEAGAIRKQVKFVQSRGRMNVLHVIGLPGTGKSWCCLRLAELISEDIHGKNEIKSRNVVNDLLGLLKFIRAVKKDGEIVICEEIGVWLSSKRAMSSENVDAGYVWDTLRKKRVIVIANNPISRDIDKKFMALSTMMIQTLSLNKSRGICILKPLRLQTNPDTAKTYRHRLKEEGYEIHRCWTGRPSKELTDQYEGDKDTFMDRLYERLQKKHEEKQDKALLTLVTKVNIPSPLQARRKQLHVKGMTHEEIAKMEGVTRSCVTKSIRLYDENLENLKNEKGVHDQTSKATT